jgi:hypothetical protein
MVDKDIVGMKWDDMILRVEWKWEILQWLEKSSLNKTEISFMTEMSTKYPEQFDGLTISSLPKMTVLQEEFEEFILFNDFRERYSENRTIRLKQLFDSQLENNVNLHPGF